MREVLPGMRESSWERERLLEALDAYRRGLSDAPLLRKWNGGGLELDSDSGRLGMARQPVPGERTALQQVQDERMGGGRVGMSLQSVPGERVGGAAGGRVGSDGLPVDAATGRVRMALQQVQDERANRAAGGPQETIGKEADGAGAMTFVISSEEVDRHGDVVSAAGWQLAAYRQNPVFLWAHDYTRPVIGRAAAVWPEPGLLLARMEFAPTDFAAEVAALYRSGYQQGVSVGFKPLRYAERRQEQTGAFLGIRFLEQELLEVSAVPVPANRQALRRAMEQSPRLGDYLCRASGLSPLSTHPELVDGRPPFSAHPELVEGWHSADRETGVSPGLAAALAEVRPRR